MKAIFLLALVLSGCSTAKVKIYAEDACKQALSGEWVCEE